MNIEAKRKQPKDMQYNDESDSSIDDDLSTSELHDPEDGNVAVPIAPSAQASAAGSSGRDSFFMSTGWSADNLPLVSDSPAVTSSKHATTSTHPEKDDNVAVPPPPKAGGAQTSAGGSSVDSFFASTGWSADNLPLVSDSPVVASSNHATTLTNPEKDDNDSVPPPPKAASAHTSAGGSSDRDSFLMSTGWSMDNMPLVSDSPVVTSSKHATTSRQDRDDSEGDLNPYELKTGWSMDDLPMVGTSPRASPSVLSRKGNTSMNMDDLQRTGGPSPLASPARKSSTSLHMTSSTSLQMTIQEEESSMQSSDDDVDTKPPPPSSGTRRNSATMVLMDGSIRSV